MIIRFSRHARQRMRERNISSEIIKKALLNQNQIQHIEGDKFICYHTTGSNILAVVFIKRKEYYKIITVYYENNL